MLAPFPVSLPLRQSSQPPKKRGEPAAHPVSGPSNINSRPPGPEPGSVPSSPVAEPSRFSSKSFFLRKRTTSLSTPKRPGPLSSPPRDLEDQHGPPPLRPPRNPARKMSRRPSTSPGLPHDAPAKAGIPVTSPTGLSTPFFVRVCPSTKSSTISCSRRCFSLFPT